MGGRPVVRRRYAQARRVRRFEMERPDMRAIVNQGANWTTVNVQRLPGLVLTMTCVLLLAFMFSDSRFYVYRAEVTGNRLFSAGQLYEGSGADMCSVFFLAPRAIQQKLLERYPGLQQVQVAVDLPAQLHIRVLERKVLFVWEVAGQTYLADDRGTVLGSAPPPADALLIRSPAGPEPVQGQVLDGAVLETAKGLNELLGGQCVFEYSPRFGVSWYTNQGWPVHFGLGGDLGEKVAVMRTMLAQLERMGSRPEFLDVGVPSRPYYR